MEEKPPLFFDVVEVQKHQQNRYPLLFIDYVKDVVPYKKAVGVKNFTFNEWYFPVHFEDDPNVPGFIQVECLIQTFIMTFLCDEKYKGKKTNFISIENVKFKRKIVPGDQLIINAELTSFRRGIAKGFAKSFVGDELACYGKFVVSIPDVFNNYIPK